MLPCVFVGLDVFGEDAEADEEVASELDDGSDCTVLVSVNLRRLVPGSSLIRLTIVFGGNGAVGAEEDDAEDEHDSIWSGGCMAPACGSRVVGMGIEERGFVLLAGKLESGVTSNTGCLMSLISCFWYRVCWLYMWSLVRLECDGESRLKCLEIEQFMILEQEKSFL